MTLLKAILLFLTIKTNYWLLRMGICIVFHSSRTQKTNHYKGYITKDVFIITAQANLVHSSMESSPFISFETLKAKVAITPNYKLLFLVCLKTPFRAHWKVCVCESLLGLLSAFPSQFVTVNGETLASIWAIFLTLCLETQTQSWQLTQMKNRQPFQLTSPVLCWFDLGIEGTTNSIN